MSAFRDELKGLINQYSRENGSDTPDFILAQYLESCLEAFDKAVQERDRLKWPNASTEKPRLPMRKPLPLD